MFEKGDAVVHPNRGVGIVIDIREREWQGSSSKYYQIELLGRKPGIKIMIPVEEAKTMGIRRAIAQSDVEQVWEVLRSEPEDLPSNHKTRHKFLRDKLYAGEVFQVAEVLRDLTWRREEEGHLTTRGGRIFKKGMRFLSGEIAAAKGIDVAAAKSEIRSKLMEIVSTKSQKAR